LSTLGRRTPEGSDLVGESRQLKALVALVGDVLKPDLVGAYVYGSAVLGGQVPTSDLDLLVVSRRRLTPAERARLVKEVLVLSASPAGEVLGCSKTRPIELTIVLESAIRPWRYPPEMEFQYGDWLRADYLAGFVPPPAPNQDLAVLLEMARRDGRTVAGSPPADLLEAVPWNDLVASMVHGLDGLMQDLETDTRNVILTLARIWMTLATGEFRRKDEAAAWAAERLPSEFAAVLDRARAMYLDGTYGPWAKLEPSVIPTAHRLVSDILRLATAPATVPSS
jgi:predicted nucleotidyltransferase